MRKLPIFFLFLLIIGCSSSKNLYTWENYDLTSYNYLKNADEESVKELKETYTKIIEEQKGTRNVPPPGIYADFGFLLIQEGETERGKELLAKEIELYPESEKFITRILKMIEK